MQVLRTGEADLVTRITGEMLEAAAQDEEHWELLQELKLKSYICAPLRVKDKILGENAARLLGL